MLLVATCAFLFSACTERISVEPITTADDDWTPSIQIIWHGYERVRIHVDGPPRKELLRNIERYVLESTAGDTSFFPVDTASTTIFSPSYITLPYATYGNNWETKPRLAYGVPHWIRLAVHYRTGVVRRSTEDYLFLDVGRGVIVRRVPQPPWTYPYYYPDFYPRLTRWKGKLLFSRTEHVYAIDTATGASTRMLDILPMPVDWNASRSDFDFESMGVDGDTLCAAIQLWNERRVRLHRINLTSLVTDTSVSIPISIDWWLQGASVYNDRIALLESKGSLMRISVFDTRSGILLQRYPSGLMSHTVVRRFHFDGSRFWVAAEYYLDDAGFNSVRELDPISLGFTVTHRNPIFRYGAFVWDPPYVWIEDSETSTIAKVLLEGY